MARMKSGSRRFNAEHGDELAKFFAEAQIQYASGTVTPMVMGDGGSLLEYADGSWSYSDTWYGGEPYSGMTVISYNGVACFSMVYWGRIMPYADLDETTHGLMEALQHPHPKHPWRGPCEYVIQNGMHYTNEWSGSTRRFSGIERIVSADGKETLYEASYMGGIINMD